MNARRRSCYVAAACLLTVATLAEALCTPEEWEGFIFGKIATSDTKASKVSLVDVGIQYSRDGSQQRAFAREIIHNSMEKTDDIELLVYDLYSEGHRYLAYPKYQHCEQQPLPSSLPSACVPDSTLQGSYVVAGQPVNVYQVSVPLANGTGSMDINISINPKLAIPVGQIVTSAMDGVYSMSSYTFANVTSGIHDPSIFTPPPYCQKAVDVVAAPFPATFVF